MATSDRDAPAATESRLRRRGLWLIWSMALTFVLMRAWLHWRPDTDLNIGPYNVHHLFTGVLLVTVAGIPAVLGYGGRRLHDWLVGGFGVGVSLALDQWVYLIVTDGTNASYLLPVSLVPAIVLVGLACAYTGWLMRHGAGR